MTNTKPMTDEWHEKLTCLDFIYKITTTEEMILREFVQGLIDQAASKAREEERLRIENEWLRITEGAEDLAKNLEVAYGEGSCKICGCDPIHQRQFFLSLIQKG